MAHGPAARGRWSLPRVPQRSDDPPPLCPPQEITIGGRTTHTIPTRKDRRIADRLSLVRRIPPQVFPTDRAHMVRPQPHPPINREGCCPPRTPASPPGR